MTTPTRTICSPWALPPDLPATRSKLADDQAADDAAWEDLLWQASEMLFALSGRQFTGLCESTVAVWSHTGRDRDRIGHRLYPGHVGTGAAAAGVDGPRGALMAALPGRPVRAILAATLNGQPLALEADLPAGLVWRVDGRPWPARGATPAEVTYTHGQMPDQGGVAAAVTLAVELAKARSGGACRLPARMSSVQRQGVSVDFAAPAEALGKGRTGIWEIDAWLATVNRHGLSAPPSVWSPDVARTRRKVT